MPQAFRLGHNKELLNIYSMIVDQRDICIPYAHEEATHRLFTKFIFKTRFQTFKLQKRIQNLKQFQ